MPEITLPDGSKKQFDETVTPRQIAESIGPRLAKAAVAARVGGDLVDLDRPITEHRTVAIVTKSDEDDDALYVVRHSCAHVMA